MKNYLFPVYLATAFLLIYVAGILLNLHTAIILFGFFLSPFVILYMAYKVLTADVEVKHTFKEKQYEDEIE